MEADLEKDDTQEEERPRKEGIVTGCETLGSTPSRRDGIDAETEDQYRLSGCHLINQAGIMLHLYTKQIPPLLPRCLGRF